MGPGPAPGPRFVVNFAAATAVLITWEGNVLRGRGATAGAGRFGPGSRDRSTSDGRRLWRLLALEQGVHGFGAGMDPTGSALSVAAEPLRIGSVLGSAALRRRRCRPPAPCPHRAPGTGKDRPELPRSERCALWCCGPRRDPAAGPAAPPSARGVDCCDAGLCRVGAVTGVSRVRPGPRPLAPGEHAPPGWHRRDEEGRPVPD